MNRANWKGPYINKKKINEIKKSTNVYNLIMPRNNKILPKFLGMSVKVFNGKKYDNFIINKEMLGHKFGEFSATRALFSFKKKKSKK